MYECVSVTVCMSVCEWEAGGTVNKLRRLQIMHISRKFYEQQLQQQQQQLQH